MKRRALHLALIASVLGALCVWAVVLSMGPRLRARKASNRLVERAQELAGEGNRWASRQLVDQALALDQSNPRARRELAMHLRAEGRREAALAELKRVAVAQPTDSGAARELAALLSVMGDGEGAIHWLREAVKREPKNGLAYVDLARCLMEAGEVADGLRAAEEAVLLSPRLRSAQLVLGWARWRSGDLSGARAALDEALRLRRNDVDALLAAAAVSSELGLGDSALGYARRAVAADPQRARTWLVLAGVLAATGRTAEAHDALARARSLEPTDPLPPGSTGVNGGRQHIEPPDDQETRYNLPRS